MAVAKNPETDTLFALMQNDALGAIAFHSFTLGYNQVAKHKGDKDNFPKLSYMFFVLPIVYNYASMTTFLSSHAIYTALNKDPAIKLGLHSRSLKMSQQTFNGLNVAFSKNILGYNKNDSTIILLRPYTSKKLVLTMGDFKGSTSVKKIQDCSYKLGNIFAKFNEKNIQLDLNIFL